MPTVAGSLTFVQPWNGSLSSRSGAGETSAVGGGASVTVTASASDRLLAPSPTVSVSVYEPAALNVALVAAAVGAENVVAATLDEVHANVSDAAGVSVSVAVPVNDTVAFGRAVDMSAPASTV